MHEIVVSAIFYFNLNDFRTTIPMFASQKPELVISMW